MFRLILSACLSISVIACTTDKPQESIQSKPKTYAPTVTNQFLIDFEKYQLDNGLTIILHQDKSDPIVAVSTIVHVGSNREKSGRTGFAHFFEHMAFNDSENVPQGANRKMIEELGGTRNGGTWSDGTIYYEVVPKDAFEKLMWIDSDRLGFMINTVSEGALEREKQVVKNEKRQRVDNQAYGHTDHVIRKNLYPTNHPYNWTVIGDLADLQAATLNDVKEFYHQYYGPSNATIVIAGDIDIKKTKRLVEQWFGEIKKSKPVSDLPPQPVALSKNKKLFHLDAFAKVPEIRVTYPTVEEYHPDSYALDILGSILSDGKRAPLYQEIVNSQKLAPSVSAYQNSNEIAGTFTIRVRANKNIDLDKVNTAINQSLYQFEKNGFSDNDLKRIKARQETQFYNGISSVLNKAFKLGRYNEYAGDPSFISQDIQNIKNVSRQDIERVYQKYIKNKHFVMTSFVPQSQPQLIVDGSQQAKIEEEKIVSGTEKKFDSNQVTEYQKTPTQHDRSEPELGSPPLVSLPDIFTSTSENGLVVFNIEHNELPLVNFSLRVNGGTFLESSDKLGTATLLAALLNEGTQSKTPEELEDAIGLLGAEIEFSATDEGIFVKGNTLVSNYPETMELMSEMLLQPRWDTQEFERLKARQLNMIQQNKAQPFSVASNVFNKQLYGNNHRAGYPMIGTQTSVSQLSIDDLKIFYHESFSPKNSSLHIVGNITQQEALNSIENLTQKWQGDLVPQPNYNLPKAQPKSKIYFVDIPDAKQSVIVVGKIAIEGNHPDYYNFNVAQNRLGSGSSAKLFQTLRIEKGYTYGAYSLLRRKPYKAPFMAYSQVRTNVTLESLEIFKKLIRQYDEELTKKDLEITKNLLIKRNTRQFETIDNLINMLDNISLYQLPTDYVEAQQATLKNFTLNKAKNIFQAHADEKEMIYVVVGDAKTQLQKVKEFGYGNPLLLDRDGNLIEDN